MSSLFWSVSIPIDGPMQPPFCNKTSGDHGENKSPEHVTLRTMCSVFGGSQDLSSGYLKQGKMQLWEMFDDGKVSASESELQNNINGQKSDLASSQKIPGVQEIQRLLAAQQCLMHQQIEELKRVFILQLNLTGVNPLSQEMKVTINGSKAGRRPEDSITKEALRYLQDVFSIKDTITKKEACDISVRVGAPRAQVRDFFAGQQSRVRKLVQQSNEEAGHVVNSVVGPTESVAQKRASVQKQSGIVCTADFCELLLEQMQSESSFGGQAELLNVITQTEKASFLRMFLDKGGIQVLGKWLLKAAVEEQTTLLRSLLKVLSNLPINYAVPGQMSAIVQAVNKLRFYGITDVATRARMLLAKWSKAFGRHVFGKSFYSFNDVLHLKRPEASPGAIKRNREPVSYQAESSSEQKKVKIEMFSQTNSKSHPISSLQSSLDTSQSNASLDVSKEVVSSNISQLNQEVSVKINPRSTPQQPMEQSRKRLVPAYGKERRKVLLVDELVGSSRRGKDVDVRRIVATDKFSRPLSTDDIQKAKVRARLLQNSNAKQIVAGSSDLQSDKQEYIDVIQAHDRGLKNTILQRVPEANRNFNLIISEEVFDTLSNQKSSHRAYHSSNETVEGITSMSTTQDGGYGKGKSGGRPCCPLKVTTVEGTNPQLQNQGEKRTTITSPIRSLDSKISLTPEGTRGVLQDEALRTMVVSIPGNLIEDARDRNERLTTSHGFKNGSPAAINSLSNNLDKEVSMVAKKEASPRLTQPSQVLEQSSARAKFLSERTNWLPWSLPPEVFLDPRWSTAAGEDSKEKSIQFDRVSREEEAFYLDLECIPENPKAPWDEEPDCDDSLTLEVPSDASASEEARQAIAAPVYNPVVDESPSVNIQESSNPSWPEVSLAIPMVCKTEAVSPLFSGVKIQSSKPSYVNCQAIKASEVENALPQSTSSAATAVNYQGVATTALKAALPQFTSFTCTSINHEGTITTEVKISPPQIATTCASTNHPQVPTSEVKTVPPQDTAFIQPIVNHQRIAANEVNIAFSKDSSSALKNTKILKPNTSGQLNSQVGVTSSDLINHDPQLLAFLLRNPELLSQLTSQQAVSQDRSNMSIPSGHEIYLEAQKPGGMIASSHLNMSVTNATIHSLAPGPKKIAGLSEHTTTNIISYQSTALSSRGFQPPYVQVPSAPVSVPKLEGSSFPPPSLIMPVTTSVHISVIPDRKISANGPFPTVSERNLGGITATMTSSTSILAQPSPAPTTGLLRLPKSEHATYLTGMVQSYPTVSSRQTQLNSLNLQNCAVRQSQYPGHAPPLPPESRVSSQMAGFEEASHEGSSLRPHRNNIFTQEKFIGRGHSPNVAHSGHEQANNLFQNPQQSYLSGTGRAVMTENEIIRRLDHVKVGTRVSNNFSTVPVWMPNGEPIHPLPPSGVTFQHKQHSNTLPGVASLNRPILSTPVANVIVPPREISSPHVRWSNGHLRSTWRGQ